MLLNNKDEKRMMYISESKARQEEYTEKHRKRQKEITREIIEGQRCTIKALEDKVKLLEEELECSTNVTKQKEE